jgi:hypothetical protein
MSSLGADRAPSRIIIISHRRGVALGGIVSELVAANFGTAADL